MRSTIVALAFFFISCWSGANTEALSEEGYLVGTTEDVLAATTSSEQLECPSKNVIRVKYKCPSSAGKWIDCTKLHCCPGYSVISGQCVPKDTDPCTLNLCEQRCDVILGRIVCTCWNGYRFSPQRQRKGEKPTCIDIDECKEGTHDCEQICVNTPGEFACRCKEGYALLKDNRTCEKLQNRATEQQVESGCVASCDTVDLLQKKVKKLQEKITALETAVKLSIPAPTEITADGNSSGDNVQGASAAFSDNPGDKTYSVLDSFVQSGGGFCKCQRGPIGPPGPPGATGQKGEPGEKGQRGTKGGAGNFDFLLLLLADVRHDIVLLQERVFPGETLPKFDIETVLKKQRSVVEPGADGIQHFTGTKISHVSDYPTDGVESSGDEWDQY